MKGAHPLVWTALALALAWIGLRRFERMMLFIPSRAMDAHPGTVGLAWEKLTLTASDGTRLRAWWIPGPRSDAPVLLCLHGNGGNLSTRVDKMRIFHDAGAAQLWVEWRGYGESGGAPDEPGLSRDARAGWDWLQARGAAAATVAIYGESLGSGPAVELATRVASGGLIVDSGFSSIADMARVVLPWFPPRLARVRFDNFGKLARLALPVLFLHSPQDDVIPYEQAQRNFAACASARKTFVDLKGSHNEGFLDSMPAYREAIRAFLASLRAPGAAKS